MTPTIALVSGDFRPARCGVAHYTARLADALAAAGARAVVLTTRAAAGEPNLARERSGDGTGGASGGAIGAVGGWSLAGLFELAAALARLRPAVVHLQYAPSSYGHSRAIQLAPPLLRWLRLPVVATLHEYGGWDYRPPLLPAGLSARLAALGERRRWWDREALLLAAQSDRVLTTNAGHRDLLASRLPGLAGALRLVPIGPNVAVAPGDPAALRRRTRAELGLGADEPVACFFGFLHPVKGLETLLRAFAQLRERRPGARLLLVGGFESLALPGPAAARYRQRVEALIAELGLGQAALLTGYLPDGEVSARLRAADVCALPFHHGANLKSGSLLAALAHGIPTVAALGEPPDPALAEGGCVLPVPPRQPAALAAALDDLLGSAALRAQLRAAGLRLAAQHAWPEIARQHLALYRELAPAKLGGPAGE